MRTQTHLPARRQPEIDIRIAANRAEKRVLNPGYQVLTVPGLHGSGPRHWQTLWERAHPDYRRVMQRNWDDPRLDEWAEAIEYELAASQSRALIVAHSFGCLAAVRYATRAASRIAGAFLVAPADPQRFAMAKLLPKRALPFPSLLIASSNDPWLSERNARVLAQNWGSRYVDVGPCGHINAESGFGQWLFGERLLYEFQKLIGGARQLSQVV